MLFYNTVANYFSFDARFLKSIIPLMLKPGYIARQYVDGKRLKFLHPAQHYLFASFVFFILFSFNVDKQSNAFDSKLNTINDQIENALQEDSINIKKSHDTLKTNQVIKAIKANKDKMGIDNTELKAIDSVLKGQKNDDVLSFSFKKKNVDSLLKTNAPRDSIYTIMGMSKNAGFFEKRMYKKLLKIYEQKGNGWLKIVTDTIPLALFFLLPIFAFILKLLHYKKGSYAHHLVFSFYYFSFLFTVFILLSLINFIWDIPSWIEFLVVLSIFFYLWLAVKHFYKQSWFVSWLKSGVATIVYMLVVVPISLVFTLIISFFNY